MIKIFQMMTYLKSNGLLSRDKRFQMYEDVVEFYCVRFPIEEAEMQKAEYAKLENHLLAHRWIQAELSSRECRQKFLALETEDLANYIDSVLFQHILLDDIDFSIWYVKTRLSYPEAS